MELNENNSEVNTKLNVIKYNNSEAVVNKTELNRNDSEVNSQINRIK